MSKFTIKDIAQKLDISASKVSRALSNHPDISSETKARVKRIAQQLQYRPNIIAQSLKSKSTRTIGVLVPEIENHFFSAAISGIEEVAYQSGYNIMVCRSNEDYEREKLNLNAFLSNRVAGIIASISQNTIDGSHFQNVINSGVPLVFFDRVIESLDSCKVVINDRESAYNAVEYLIKTGYKKIGHLCGKEGINISVHRLKGFREAMVDHGLEISEDWIVRGGFHSEDGYDSMEKLLDLDETPEAIFAVNDPVAIGAIKKIREVGLSIPGDIAIIGFSDNPICEVITPNLTTVHQPSYQMGKKSAELILESIQRKEKPLSSKTITLETNLIVRDST
jgi:LacI family transcriptional regulator